MPAVFLLSANVDACLQLAAERFSACSLIRTHHKRACGFLLKAGGCAVDGSPSVGMSRDLARMKAFQ